MRPLKATVLSALFLLSPIVFADPCADFSGSYAWSDEEGNYVGIDVTQSACDEIVMNYDAFGVALKYVHQLDGQKRLVQDDGDFQAYETAKLIDGTHLDILEERRGIDQEDGDDYLYYVKIDFFLNGDGNLVEIRDTLREDGVNIDHTKTTYLRQKP